MNYFERFEKKFLITLAQKEKIKEKFNNIFRSEFKNGYSCYSLYFDDLNFSTLKQKQEGLTERHKIRLRGYFHDMKDKIKQWQLEIKSKKNNIVKKKKITFKNHEVKQNLLKKNYSFFSKNFFETSRTYYQPTYITFYHRDALISDILPHCRITFDTNIRCFKYRNDLFGKTNINQNYILNPNRILLELKYTNFLPKFISDYFVHLNLEQVTFSKYVDGYEQYMTNPINT